MSEVKNSISEDEKIRQIEERIEVLKKRKREIQNREKERLRKERNHRLIQIGGLAEKYAGGEIDLELFEKYCMQYGNALKNLTK